MPSQFSTDWVVNDTLRTPTAYYVMQSGDKEHLQSTMVSSALPSTPKAVNTSSAVTSRFLMFSKAVMSNNHTNGRPRGRNGVVSPSVSPNPHPLPATPPPPPHPPDLPRTKTEGAHSGEQSSVTTLTTPSERSQLVCPELAVNYSSSLIGSRCGQLSKRQRELEQKLASLQRELRERQLLLVHKHAQAQIESHSEREDSFLSRRSCSLEPSPPVEVMQVDGAPADSLGSRADCQRLDSVATPISSDLSGYCGGTTTSMSSLSGESSSLLDWSIESDRKPDMAREEGCTVQSATHIQQQLELLEGMVDEEMTDESSDEEEGEEAPSFLRRMRHNDIKKRWERSRASISSRWHWLERRITQINNEICHLDNQLQKRPSRERFMLSQSPHVLYPSAFTLTNGALMDIQRGNGSLIAAANAATAGAGKGRVVNGFNHHPVPTTSAAAFHHLLPEGIFSTRLQVKDLLTPSPLGRNLSMILEEAGNVASRTRPLERRPRRKIVKMQVRKRRRREALGRVDEEGEGGRDGGTMNPCIHPQLSLPEELPSRVWLDSAVRQITLEHSYAELPLCKSRKAASTLPSFRNRLSTTGHDQRSLSHSPSPVHTPGSASKPARKRSHLSDSTPGSPALSLSSSLPMSSPYTTPLLRKRRITVSTPSFDIDNIVIPYSVYANARPEKLEYKEILTPSWREVEMRAEKVRITEVMKEKQVAPPEAPTVVENGDRGEEQRMKPSAPEFVATRVAVKNLYNPEKLLKEEEEDLSDELFTKRHEKCELLEKKRFLNFISGSGGSGRKKARPLSLASTPEHTSGSPHPLAGTGKGSQRRSITSPVFMETETHPQSQVPPWTPRHFPLGEKDMDLLCNPIPPPRIIRPSPSPSPLHARSYTPTDSPLFTQKPHTPLSPCSTLATPLSSPASTPLDGSPLISPTEWMVIDPVLTGATNTLAARPAPLPETDHGAIILKFSKRT